MTIVYGGVRWVERTPPRYTKSVRWSNVTLSLAAVLYTCQEMLALQTRLPESRAAILEVHISMNKKINE